MLGKFSITELDKCFYSCWVGSWPLSFPVTLGNFMDVFVCTCVLVCVEVRGQHERSSFICSLPYFLRRGLSLDLELTSLARWVASKPPESSCLLLYLWDRRCGLYAEPFLWSWGLNSCLHGCVKSILPTEKLPCPPSKCIWINNKYIRINKNTFFRFIRMYSFCCFGIPWLCDLPNLPTSAYWVLRLQTLIIRPSWVDFNRKKRNNLIFANFLKIKNDMCTSWGPFVKEDPWKCVNLMIKWAIWVIIIFGWN